MLLDRCTGRGPQDYFQLDDATFPQNVAPDAVARLFQADVIPEPPLEKRRQGFRELVLVAQQGKTWQSRILRY